MNLTGGFWHANEDGYLGSNMAKMQKVSTFFRKYLQVLAKVMDKPIIGITSCFTSNRIGIKDRDRSIRGGSSSILLT